MQVRRISKSLREGPEHLRSDNGPEFTAKLVRRWLARIGVQTHYIEPGSPWENGYVESFNGKLRYDFLNGEIFYTLLLKAAGLPPIRLYDLRHTAATLLFVDGERPQVTIRVSSSTPWPRKSACRRCSRSSAQPWHW